jgi:predicted secreted protein
MIIIIHSVSSLGITKVVWRGAMKLRFFLTLAILITILLLSSCVVTSHDYKAEISCGEFREINHRSDTFNVEVGDKIRLELCSNPTTGFQWDYETTIANVLKEEDHDFEEPKTDVPGAPSIELWTFEAVNKGTTEVQMEYSQPWDGGIKAEWTFTIKVMVE